MGYENSYLTMRFLGFASAQWRTQRNDKNLSFRPERSGVERSQPLFDKMYPLLLTPLSQGERPVPSPKIGEGQDGVSFSPPKIGGVRDGMKLLFGDRDLSTPLEVTFFCHFDEPPIGGEEKSLPLFDDRDLSATLEVTTTGTCHLDRNGVEWSGAERSIALFSK